MIIRSYGVHADMQPLSSFSRQVTPFGSAQGSVDSHPILNSLSPHFQFFTLSGAEGSILFNLPPDFTIGIGGSMHIQIKLTFSEQIQDTRRKGIAGICSGPGHTQF